MNIQVITIGTEILTGHTTNTNLTFVGDCLAGNGYTINKEVCVADTPEAIRDAVNEALKVADLVITMGGLGPTRDDMTRQVVAEALDLPLMLDRQVLEKIQAYIGKRGINVDSSVLEIQAMIPEGATPLINNNGTAPGLWCPAGDADKIVALLPGPPRELRPMFTADVMPRIRELSKPDTVRTMIRTCGIPESVAAAKLDDFMAEYPNVDVAYCARPAMVDIRLSTTPEKLDLLENAEAHIRKVFGDAVLDGGDEDVVDEIGRLLKERRWRLATAESCTGGGVGAAITERAGVSDFFAGGIICYSNTYKQRFLNINSETLAECGAVSAETAQEMISGLLAVTGADAGIAVTGIAGPTGGTPEKPVGLVFIATALQNAVHVEKFVFPGSRSNVRERTVAMALNQLRLDLLRAREDSKTESRN